MQSGLLSSFVEVLDADAAVTATVLIQTAIELLSFLCDRRVIVSCVCATTAAAVSAVVVISEVSALQCNSGLYAGAIDPVRSDSILLYALQLVIMAKHFDKY